MARIKNTVKKAVWKDFTPSSRMKAFIFGDAYSETNYEFNLKMRIASVWADVWERQDPAQVIKAWEQTIEYSKANGHKLETIKASEKRLEKFRRKLPAMLKKAKIPIGVFTKTKEGSLAWRAQDVMQEVMGLLFGCLQSNNGGPLRILANIIESRAGQRPDDHRIWITFFFYPETGIPHTRFKQEPKSCTFKEFYESFGREFPRAKIKKQTLRTMVTKEMGLSFLPGKKGAPTGPRNW